MTFVTAAECGWDFNIWPCELDSQLNCIAPGLVSPKTVTCPVPFALILKSILESPPVAFIKPKTSSTAASLLFSSIIPPSEPALNVFWIFKRGSNATLDIKVSDSIFFSICKS